MPVPMKVGPLLPFMRPTLRTAHYYMAAGILIGAVLWGLHLVGAF